MNIEILPLSEKQSFVFQKCVIPQELFPKDVLPGSLAKCTTSAGAEYICNIFPMTNVEQTSFCWLEDTVKVGSVRDSVNASATLMTLEFLNTNAEPGQCVHLSFDLTENLFKIKEIPSRDLLIAIAKELLQPYTFVNNSFVDLEELRELGIANIRLNSRDVVVFTITDETDVVVSSVRLKDSYENQLPQKLEAMEIPRRQLQQLVQSVSVYRDLHWKVKPSLNALVVGQSGCGKSSLCTNFILENNCNSYVIRLANILGQYPGETEAELRRIFCTVKNFVESFNPEDPFVILIENLDLICPQNRSEKNDATNTNRVIGQLISLLDHLHNANESFKIIVLATTSNLDAISPSLRRPGRFGIEINIPNLTEVQRGIVFRSMVQNSFYGNSIQLTDDLVDSIPKQTQGFAAADLALLVHSVGQELLSKKASMDHFEDKLKQSLQQMKPASSRGTDVVVYKTDEKFDQIGGMDQLKKVLDVAVLAGLRHKAAFERFGLCLPKGILLYGPPGCAKTSIAKCLATEANMTFIPTSAAEVYSPYVGNSEKFISKIFDTARKNSPCLVFLDEIDSLVGKRTTDSKSDVQIRILSTLLTEMDGIGVKLYSNTPGGNDILVVAATNRPEMVDDALMRPGRFDKLIHVPAPDYQSRLKIIQFFAAKMPFASDVDTSVIATATEDFSGADICNLCNEAAMHAFTRDIDAEYITMEDFTSILEYQKSSLTQAQIRWYSEFESSHKR